MTKDLIEIEGGALVDPETRRIVEGPRLSEDRARAMAKKSWQKRRRRQEKQSQRFLETFNLSDDQLQQIASKARTAIVLMQHVQDELAALEQGYQQILEEVENA